MLGETLLHLRKRHHYTQEDVAEQIGVSRQTIAKWENSESIPDVLSAGKLAELYDVSLDEMLSEETMGLGLEIGPKGKYVFGLLTVGANRELILPEKACRLFHIHSGDELLLLGDVERGLALLNGEFIKRMLDQARKDAMK